MRSTRQILAAIWIILAALGMNCSEQKSNWRGKIVEEGGVPVVQNPKEPIHEGPVIELVEDLTIRGSEEDDEQMFQSINTMDVDEEGFIYILDEQAGNIKVFDSDGHFLKSIGKKGQGPGEFGLPISLALLPGNKIVVNDMGQRKLLFFDKGGNYLEQISLADKFLFLGPVITADGQMIAMHTVPSEKPETFLNKFSPQLDPILTFTSVHIERPPVADIFVAFHMSRLMWNVTPDGRVIWADIKDPAYLLHEHDLQGELIRKITKEFDPIPVTAEDRERLLDKAFGDNPARDQWDVRFPDIFPPLRGISCDDEGRLFVRRYEREENGPGELYDIFDEDRRYVASQRFSMNPLIWKKGFMYAIEEDAEGFKMVKRYKVEWGI